MHNENKSRQTQTSATEVTNLNVQDTEGVTLAQSSGNTITVTDQGAIKAAGDIAYESIDLVKTFGGDALSLGDRVTGRALDFGTNAFNFAGDTLRTSLDAVDRAGERVSSATNDALQFGESSFDRAFEFGRQLFDSSIETVTGVLQEGQAQLGNTVTNLNNIARQQSTSEAERVQDIASQALKIGAVMVGLIALAFVFTRVRA